MITAAHAQLMSRYNSWQNRSIYGAADNLTDDARRLDRGAFFGSIHGTLNHLLWGDQLWMSRFAGTPKPSAPNITASTASIDAWDDLKTARFEFDQTVAQWTASVTDDWLANDLTWYSGATGKEITKPAWLLVAHMFNHQTHHRGQVHCMLTQAGAKPDDTDIPFMPE